MNGLNPLTFSSSAYFYITFPPQEASDLRSPLIYALQYGKTGLISIRTESLKT